MADDAKIDFAEFYAAELPRVVAQVYALTGDLAEAQDAAQEAFVRAWSRWGRLASYDDPSAWLLTVAHRLTISQWRRSQIARSFARRQAPLPAMQGPDPSSVALVEALRQLPSSQQRALVLYYLADRSVSEISAIERQPEGTIKARLSRGRTALAALLADAAQDPEEKGAAR